MSRRRNSDSYEHGLGSLTPPFLTLVPLPSPPRLLVLSGFAIPSIHGVAWSILTAVSLIDLLMTLQTPLWFSHQPKARVYCSSFPSALAAGLQAKHSRKPQPQIWATGNLLTVRNVFVILAQSPNACRLLPPAEQQVGSLLLIPPTFMSPPSLALVMQTN